jgi:hypothetical protein
MAGTSRDLVIWSEPEHRVAGIEFSAENSSDKSFPTIGGYFQSLRTNERFPLLLDGMPPEETHGVPPRCHFTVRVKFPNSAPPREGFTVEDFWRHFGEFRFLFTFDGQQISRDFSRQEIEPRLNRAVAEAFRPRSDPNRPRVVKKVLAPEKAVQPTIESKPPTFIRYDVQKLTVLDSFNVASVTDNGVGDFTVSFTRPLKVDALVCHAIPPTPNRFAVTEITPTSARVKFDEEPQIVALRFDEGDAQT